MDTAPNEEKFLPKEPLDLPRAPLDLPLPEKEISAHATPPTNEQPQQHETDQETVPSQEHSSYPDEDISYEVKTLLAWTAPGRPFRARGKE
jgi:hypothetical protein